MSILYFVFTLQAWKDLEVLGEDFACFSKVTSSIASSTATWQEYLSRPVSLMMPTPMCRGRSQSLTPMQKCILLKTLSPDKVCTTLEKLNSLFYNEVVLKKK